MYQYKGLEDTIAAVSTAAGAGGIGIIRLSGTRALAIADEMFKGSSKQKPSQFKNYTARHGWIVRNGALIDEVLVLVMRAPKSYTTEDVVEISCHGGTVALRMILHYAVDLGARLAEPGEFTKRAFLNGRIDLTQAEAVLEVIHSKTEAYLNVTQHQLKGELSQELDNIRKDLMKIYTEIEAILNFPEDDADAKRGYRQLAVQIENAGECVGKLLESGEQGRILREGIKIVLCGKPNVGKSSLLNALLKQPRAIVTDVEGTTRDTIEETAQIKGIPFQLVDTAGILEPRDLIEEEAIKRSQMYINTADLILFVLDADRPLNEKDRRIIENIRNKNVVVVINKCDLTMNLKEQDLQKEFPRQKILKVSATTKESLNELEDAIVETVWHDRVVETNGLLVSNVRHIRALKECRAELANAEDALKDHLSLEFVSEQIKFAVNRLDAITGRNIDQDLLDTIFSDFCIGK